MTIPIEPLLTTAQVREILGISENSFAELMRQDRRPFPRPVQGFSRPYRWRPADVRRWIDEGVDGPDESAPIR